MTESDKAIEKSKNDKQIRPRQTIKVKERSKVGPAMQLHELYKKIECATTKQIFKKIATPAK